MDSPFATNENPIKLQHLCRMCATPCNKSVPIFGPGGEENELANKFNNYLPLKVSQSDLLPLQLCYECTNLLIQWDAAILVAVAADKKLRALLWREQQSQQFNSKDTDESEEPEQLRKRKRSSAGIQESLCCSVCNKKGMDFRGLVEHLKTHEGPVDETERSSSRFKPRSQNASSIQEKEAGDVDCLIDDLLTPVVCLETFDSDRQLRSKKQTNDSKSEKINSPSSKKGKKGRPKRSTRSVSENEVTADSDGPLVTSSTSTPHCKPSETMESDSAHSSPLNATNNNPNPSSNAAATIECQNKREKASDSQNNTFKPKVRIISAESINQTLEERAKANQTARKMESHQPEVLFASPPSGGLPSPTSPTRPPMKRLVLSGQLVKDVNLQTATPGQRFLKLSDGRIIKIIQNSTNSSGSIPQVKQKVQILTKVTNYVPNHDKPPYTLQRIPPDAIKIPESKPEPSTILKQVVQVGDKMFSFTCQPGPKHCPNRFICGFCGKRNLNPESLQEHSQLHVSKNDCSLSD